MHDGQGVSGAPSLVDVYRTPGAIDVCWQLLLERDPRESISHKKMPTWQEHTNFFHGHPYEAWYLIEADGQTRGACYLTHQREIGVGVLKQHRGHGYGSKAVEQLIRAHGPGRFLANINPANDKSIALFAKLGFTGPIQLTYERA